jgi:hypothetical protein
VRTLSQVLDEVLIDLALRCPEITLDECPPDLREKIEAKRAAQEGEQP